MGLPRRPDYPLNEKSRVRFFAKVRKTDGCWIWTGSHISTGYGSFEFPEGSQLAHRVAYVIAYGSTHGMCVLHRCDNRSCVRPEHLFLGTPKDNTHDMIEKGRFARGELHGCAKLTEASVVKIKRLIEAGLTNVAIASRFGVTDKNISLIRRGVHWTHVK